MMKQLGTKQLVGAVAGIAVLLIGVWYLALIRPETHKLTAAHAADAAAQTQISSLDGQIAQLDVYKSELDQDKAALARFEQEIPSSPDLSTVIRQIQTAAVASGVTLTSLDPTVESGSSAPSVGGAEVIPVTINVGGSYANLMSFTNALTNLQRTMVIDTVSLSGSGASMTDSMSGALFYTGSAPSSNN